MSDPQHDTRGPETHLRSALDHARRLTETRPDAAATSAWSAQAAHVGDLTVLALAMRD